MRAWLHGPPLVLFRQTVVSEGDGLARAQRQRPPAGFAVGGAQATVAQQLLGELLLAHPEVMGYPGGDRRVEPVEGPIVRWIQGPDGGHAMVLSRRGRGYSTVKVD